MNVIENYLHKVLDTPESSASHRFEKLGLIGRLFPFALDPLFKGGLATKNMALRCF